MDPVSPFSSALAPLSVNSVGAANSATALAAAGAPLAALPAASSDVDISPLGQLLSGIALSRRQLLALQGGNADAATTPATNAADEAASLAASAQLLADSFVQLRSSGIDAARLSLSGNDGQQLADQFSALSRPQDAITATGTTSQAALARIGIDFAADPVVDGAALQAAFEADRAGTLATLQQTGDLLGRVGATLSPVGALFADELPEGAELAAADGLAPPGQQATIAPAPDTLAAQVRSDALAQRQLEVRRQLGDEALAESVTEELAPAQRPSGLQAEAELAPVQGQGGPDTLASVDAPEQADQATLDRQADAVAATQAQRQLDAQRQIDTQGLARSDSVQAQQQLQEAQRQQLLRQQDEIEQEGVRQDGVKQTELVQQREQTQSVAQTQAQLREQADLAAQQAVQARAAVTAAQEAAQAATERAQALQDDVRTRALEESRQAERTAQAQADLQDGLQNTAATLTPNPAIDPAAGATAAAQNQATNPAANPATPLAPPDNGQPQAQDPGVAAAIAAYNLNNAALNPALQARHAGADAEKSLVTPVAAVTPVKRIVPIAGDGINNG